jgi:NAD(P)H dehydrogenase (quinone)
MSERQTLLVTGANGHLGSRVVAHLLGGDHSHQVVAGSRNPHELAEAHVAGVETRQADFDDPDSLAEAFEDVDRWLFISTNTIGEQRERQHHNALDAAKKAGVKHVIYTSMLNPEPGSLIPFASDHYKTELAVKASGLTWNIVRNSWYMDNLFGTISNALASGKWLSSAQDGRIANVSREDCAIVAASLLISGEAANRQYDITGPDAWTTAEIVQIISEVFEKNIELVSLSDEELQSSLINAGVSAGFAGLIVGFDANTRSGRENVVTNAVQEITQRRPQHLREFLLSHRELLNRKTATATARPAAVKA